MKNYFKQSISILLMVSILSCAKDSLDISPEITIDHSTNNRKVLELIHAFNERINNDLKSTELLEIDSVVWFTEALQNFNHARPDIAFKGNEVFKSNYLIPLEGNGLASMNNVQLFYNQAEASLTIEYSQINNDEVHLLFSDVSIDSVFDANAYISIYRVYGLDYETIQYVPFAEGDDWYWGWLLGKCDGTMVGISDASNELARRLNNPLNTSKQYFFTDLETIWTCGYAHLDPNVAAYRLYVAWGYPYEMNCLTSDTLNYFLQQSHMIIHDFDEGIRPLGKAFTHVEIIDDVIPGIPGNALHSYFITYGVPHEIEDPE